MAYLATEDHRKNGVTRDQVGRAFLLDDPVQVRKYVNMVRSWLGTNLTTGQPHLPNADKAAASKTRGGHRELSRAL